LMMNRVDITIFRMKFVDYKTLFLKCLRIVVV
jgi:hypothetical protein